MFFYNIRIKVKRNQWFDDKGDRSERYEIANEFSSKCNEFAFSHDYNIYLWINNINASSIDASAIVENEVDINKYVEEFLRTANIEYEDKIIISESIFGRVSEELTDASRNKYVESSKEILGKFDIEPFGYTFRHEIDYEECIVALKSKKELYENSKYILVENSMIPELDRIYEGKKAEIKKGHPVHYMIMADNQSIKKKEFEILINALYENKRIINKRYIHVEFEANARFFREEYEQCYKINKGGTMVVSFKPSDEEEDDRVNSGRYVIESICKMARKYRNEVLTMFLLPSECTYIKKIFFEYLTNMSFVEITEDKVSGDEAREYLKNRAINNGLESYEGLFEYIEDSKVYFGAELIEIYNNWYDEQLKTKYYPQYRCISTINKIALKDEKKGSAYDELMNMIGLDEAKKVINQAINYYRAQIIFSEKGIVDDKPSMHMIFTGNPGTAKTTVARLFARIMRDNQLLSRGHIVEVGRSDLVGKYVGWTAPIIKRRFVEAKGGVLFIDEAYSLVDDRNGSYGDEAINTIVQEMENHREDVVVIFAGYPEEMEKFLQKNPGLRSRIAFSVPFADYDTDDLCNIAELMAANKGITLSKGANKRLRDIFEMARLKDDFGNGRYVRNVLEKAKMAQATRLLEVDYELLTREDVVTICEEDIEFNVEKKREDVRGIGFVY